MENLFLKKEQSVAFTGHRFIPYGKLPILKVALKNAIIELYAKGYTNYYCGMAMGFDLLSAEVILSLTTEYKELRLIAVVQKLMVFFKKLVIHIQAKSSGKYLSISIIVPLRV